MVSNWYKNNFQFQQLLPFHETPALFTVSHWQSDKSQSHALYLVYRTLVASFFIATWFLKTDSPSWGTYMSMWSYTLCTLQFTIGFFLVFSSIFVGRICQQPKAHGVMLKLCYSLYWILHSTAVSLGFTITFIYWSFLFREKPFSLMKFIVHGLNSILMFIDILVIGHPVHILHCIYPLLVGTAYGIFSIAYHFYDQYRGGSGYVHIILNWEKPEMATLVILGIMICIILFHLLTFGVYQLKLRLHARFNPHNLQQEDNNRNSNNNRHN